MITIANPTEYSLVELEFADKLTHLARKLSASVEFGIKFRDNLDVEVKMISKAKFDAMIAAVNPLTSLPVMTREAHYSLTAAATRMSEVFRVVLGKSYYPGSDPNSQTLDDSGVEHKMEVLGTQLALVEELLVSAGGGVTVSNVIASLDSISASYGMGPLDIASAGLMLGTVQLEDTGVPIANGENVTISYATQLHGVAMLDDVNDKVVAVMLSKALYDYLAAAV